MKNATKKRRRRINCADSAGFPMETPIKVEEVTFHADGTLDLVVLDENMPPSLDQPMEAGNPRRKRAKKNTRRKR